MRLLRWITAPLSTQSRMADVGQAACGLVVVLGTLLDVQAALPYAGQVPRAKLVWCPSRLSCANPSSFLQVFSLVVARFSGGAMYSVMCLVAATTAHSCVTWFGRLARMRLNGGLFGGAQIRRVHVRAGIVLARLAMLHTFTHCLRWTARGELGQAATAYITLTGLIGTLAFCAIYPMMTIVSRKCRLSFETTMNVFHHGCVGIGLGCGALHHPRFALVVAILLVFCGFDRLHLLLFRSYVIEKPHLTAFSDAETTKHGGVLVTFSNPTGFRYETGDYVKICFPWLADGNNKKQWHPFSIAPVGVGRHEKKSMLYLQVEGDWTRRVHQHVLRTGNGYARPLILCGPFASPFNTSIMHDYLFLVASGVGITPSLSVLARLGRYRHICVLWLSRDRGLIKLYSEYINPMSGLCVEAVVHLTSAHKAEAQRLSLATAIEVEHGRPDVEELTRNLLTNGDGTFFSSKKPAKENDDVEGKPATAEESSRFSLDEPERDNSSSCVLPTEEVEGSAPSPSRRPLQNRRRYRSSASIVFPKLSLGHHSEEGQEGGSSTLRDHEEGLPNLLPTQWSTQRCTHQEPIVPEEWKVLYCGSSPSITEVLQRVCQETGAAFETEQFS